MATSKRLRQRTARNPNARIQRHAPPGDKWGPWSHPDGYGDAEDPTRGSIVTHANRLFSVQEIRRNGYHLLTVLPLRGSAMPTWHDLVRIKDELVGTDRQAVQMYPREEDFADQGYSAQLWIIDKGAELPYTFAALHRPRKPASAPIAVVASDEDEDEDGAPFEDEERDTADEAGDEAD